MCIADDSSSNSGKVIQLGNASTMDAATFGLVTQAADTMRLVQQYSAQIQQQAEQNRPAEEIAADLHADMLKAGAVCQAVSAEDIYVENAAGAQNAQVWAAAKSLSEAKTNICKVCAAVLQCVRTDGFSLRLCGCRLRVRVSLRNTARGTLSMSRWRNGRFPAAM